MLKLWKNNNILYQNSTLSPLTADLIFTNKWKLHECMHYQTSLSPRFEWSAFADCFSKLIGPVLDLDRALTIQEMTMCGFTVLRLLILTFTITYCMYLQFWTLNDPYIVIVYLFLSTHHPVQSLLIQPGSV